MFAQTPIFEKKNVIVTGGTGFLGSHLCERLLKEAKVICIDDLSNSAIENISHLLQYPDFEFIRYDVNRPIDLADFPELEKFRVSFQGVQEIYHLACPTSPKNFEQHRLRSLWANSSAMINTLDLAVKYRAKYLFTSSAVVYGETHDSMEAFTEETEGVIHHLSPRGCYDEGKRFAETCVDTYRQVYGLDAKISRIFPGYGPRMKLWDGRLIPDFITNALEGKDLVVYGDENTTQTLCYVSDIIDGLLRQMHTGSEVYIVNFGSDNLYRVADIARAIIQLTASNSKVTFDKPLDYINKKGIPNLTWAKEQLGWIPLVRLEDGLRKSIDFTLANKQALGFK